MISECTPQPVSSSSSLEPPETTESLLSSPNSHQRHVHRDNWDGWLAAQTALNESTNDALTKRARRINACCCAPLYVQTETGKLTVAPGFCRDRMCPTCQHTRSREVAARVTALCHRMNSPRMLTLTLKHVDRPLFLTIAAVSASFRELRKTTEWKRHVLGGVYVFEVTRNAETQMWHAHVHVIFDGNFWHQRDISKVWKRVTGDSKIVDVRAVHSRAAAANYVAKYVSKPTNQAAWTNAELCEFADALHGKRMLHTFGACYAEEVEPPTPGTKSVPAEPLLSANRLVWAANRGHAYARTAVELLNRCNGWLRNVLGAAFKPAGAVRVPLEPWEHERLLTCLRTVATDAADAPPTIHTRWEIADAREHAHARRQLTLLDVIHD